MQSSKPYPSTRNFCYEKSSEFFNIKINKRWNCYGSHTKIPNQQREVQNCLNLNWLNWKAFTQFPSSSCLLFALVKFYVENIFVVYLRAKKNTNNFIRFLHEGKGKSEKINNSLKNLLITVKKKWKMFLILDSCQFEHENNKLILRSVNFLLFCDFLAEFRLWSSNFCVGGGAANNTFYWSFGVESSLKTIH